MRRPALFTGLLAAALLAAALGCRAQAPAAPPLREEFRRNVLGDRKACPLNPKALSSQTVGMNQVERVQFTPEPGHDAVAAIYRPKAEGKYPVVIVQHFLGATKDSFVLLPLFNGLVQRGYLVAAIDGRYRGERQNGKSLEAALLESLRTGKEHPFLLDTTYDITRLIDYLDTRPDVDPNRIGMTGFSEGGIITWMATVTDDRIRVAVPIIGVTCFGDVFGADSPALSGAPAKLLEPVLKGYASDLGEKEITGKVLRAVWNKLVPGMLDRFDATNVVPLIAPRPLLILSHDQDELFPIEGAKKVYAAVKSRYESAKASDRVDFRIAAGLKHAGFSGAEVTGMFSWFDQWLKPME